MNKGFTLIEVLLSLVILSIMTPTSLPVVPACNNWKSTKNNKRYLLTYFIWLINAKLKGEDNI